MQMMELWNGRSIPRIGIGTWAAGGAARCRDTATIYGEAAPAADVALRHIMPGRAIPDGLTDF
ncbi:hypothetical protein [Mesorhizobium delmotii]|uniref:Aldo/keto reductase n=1 Tax=Mesorhizobium delmotii TaxID=1631247 RepID=A0A2P9AIP2_9HYPH|nr:hypothetical protein [Mesorhizobium delmotii]SJM30988.1 hypothetical protein BQ8482_180216 [Mesorhizobium delmotii]